MGDTLKILAAKQARKDLNKAVGINSELFFTLESYLTRINDPDIKGEDKPSVEELKNWLQSAYEVFKKELEYLNRVNNWLTGIAED